MDLDEKDEERQPLNAMVAENLKNAIIRKIHRDVERNINPTGKDVSPAFRQYFAASGPVISALSSGMGAGFSAVLLPQLMAEDTEIEITKEEGTWIASMIALPLLLGCIFAGYIMDTLGRKRGQILSSIPLTIGWIVLAFAKSVPVLYVGRFISGFCVGLITPMCQVYIAETSQPQHRGILLAAVSLKVAIGILLVHILGTYTHWRTTAGLCSIPSIICTINLLFAAESPLWLLNRGNTEAAQKSFRWFRGNSEEANKEFNDLVAKHEQSVKETEVTGEKPSKLKMLLDSTFWKPFIVLNFFFFVQQFSGVNAVTFYSVTILKDVIKGMDEYLAMMIIDVVRCIFSLTVVTLLKKFGRKTLSITSAVGTSVSLFLVAIYLGFYSQDNNIQVQLRNNTNETMTDLVIDLDSPSFMNYLPLVFLMSYITFVSIGLVPVPWMLTGELFSKDMRGIGSSGSSCFGFLCFFLVVKTSPDLFENLGNYGTFCFFGAVALLGSIVLTLFLPETKDKTLAEIEAFYKKQKEEEKSQNENITLPR